MINRYKFSTLIAFTLCGIINAQTQKGFDIDGEAQEDRSGTSVSMPDSNTIAIGAPFNDGSGVDAGQVRIYSWNGSTWQQKGSDIDGENPGDRSGSSVSMPDANTVAIGAPSYSLGGNVRIYTWNGSFWMQKGADINGEAAGDASGWSVCMPDSNTVAIAAPYNSGNGNSSGQVRIYSWNGNLWIQKGSDIDGEAAYDNSGYSISMTDSYTVAIGAPGNDGFDTTAGHVRIYHWNGAAWQQKGVDIDGVLASEQSGFAVSMPDTETVAIGAPYNGVGSFQFGQVRVYSWNPSAMAWIQKGTAMRVYFNEGAGTAVSMSDNNTLVIGAPFGPGGGSNSGGVIICKWNSLSGGSWVQYGSNIYGEQVGDYSGWSISTPDQNTIAIGALFNDGNGNEAGHVRIYSINCLSSASTTTAVGCYSYTVPSGDETYTVPGIYNDTILNSAGCDSFLTINVIIQTVNTAVTLSGDTLTANNTGVVYQWLDCNNNFSPVLGAYHQTFTPAVSGSYAVRIIQNGCIDTSVCYNVIVTDIIDFVNKEIIKIFPNPNNGKFTIDYYGNENLKYEIKDFTGRVLAKGLISLSQADVDLSENYAGIYLLELLQGARTVFRRQIIKE